MFFRRVVPGVWRRWRSPYGQSRRWVAGRDMPVCPPWARSPGPWNRWRAFPSPFGVMARMEREFDDMWRAMNSVWGPRYRDRYPASQSGGGGAPDIRVNYDDKTFELYLNVADFDPEDLQVKVIDQTIEVHGKHTERQDEHGSITRQFTRCVAIPEDVDPDTVTCELDDDGQLTVRVLVKGAAPQSERVINIEKKTKPIDEAGAGSNSSQ